MAQSINPVTNSNRGEDIEKEAKDPCTVKTGKKCLLNRLMLVVGWAGMIVFAFHASTHMVAAGDTWVAMACGRHFINHGVDTVEPFSANSHRAGPTWEEIATWPGWAQWIAGRVGLETVKYWHPTGWVNQNWLTHVIFYWLTHLSPFADADTFSFNTLVYWKFAIYVLSVFCIYYTARILGAHPALSAFFSCAAMFIGRSFLDIRPAGFSNLLVAVFILTLVLTTYRNILYIWLLVPLGVFWCNVHGGYIYLFIMLVPFVGLNFLTSFSGKRFISIGRKGLIHTIAAGIATFIAVVVFNPFHLTNLTHTFVISVSKHAEQWRTVNEWHPAFEWMNPVGTGFPLLVLYISGVALLLLSFFSRLLTPRLIKAPKNELEAQQNIFNTLSKIFVYIAAVFLCWIVFIAFSFLNLSTADFLISAVFAGIILLSIYKSVHFIYLAAPLTLFVLLIVDSKGYNGRYIYPFILLPSYVMLHILVLPFPNDIKFKLKNIGFVALGAIGSLLVMILFVNPFKFKPAFNLNQLFDLQRIWRPSYEGGSPLHYTYLFDVLYIVNIISAFIWLSVPYLQRHFSQLNIKTDEASVQAKYELPEIDLALIAVASLTIYMAIRSRRFIPIAAFAACPVMAMLLDRIIRTVSAAGNFYKRNNFVSSSLSFEFKLFLTITGSAAVLAFGIWWGWKFKFVYLDPWPTDTRFNSVFMRMTASYVKPFDACEFIRLNKLEGKMFNYWTEGGFIAYGQDPDPNTGRTPLQLFMDGRAQAAYQPETYRLWSNIMFGGPVAAQRLKNAEVRRRQLTGGDYAEIGEWIGKELRNHDVWVVLMPSAQFDSTFVRGLDYNTNWRVVFINSKQKLFVDTAIPRGKKLFEGILTGETIYPDIFSKDIMLAHNLILFGVGEIAKKSGLAFAIKAFESEPSQVAMVEVLLAAQQMPALRTAVRDFCKNYVDDFANNKDLYSKRDGYYHRIWTAAKASEYLQQIAAEEKNSELAALYAARLEDYKTEIGPIQVEKRW